MRYVENMMEIMPNIEACLKAGCKIALLVIALVFLIIVIIRLVIGTIKGTIDEIKKNERQGSRIIDQRLRPCMVKEEKAWFHRWNTFENVIEASPMIGGCPAGHIQYTIGLVEFEDGNIKEVPPNSIKFTDRQNSKPAAGGV